MTEAVQSPIVPVDETKQQIRCIISNVYDFQKMRISAGNRLVQNFYISLSIKPSTSPDDAGKEEGKMIDFLKWEYKRISDGVAEKNISIKKQIKELNESRNKKDNLFYIRNDTDYKLVESYMLLLEAEEQSIKVLDKYVKEHPLWDAFFKDIKGCGTLMSAVCIAYLDIYKAKYPSSFFKYCGLDTVQDEDKDGNKLYLEKINGVVTPTKVRQKVLYFRADGSQYLGKVHITEDCDAEGNVIIKSDDGEVLTYQNATKMVTVDGEQVEMDVYEEVESGDEYIGDVVVSQHGRRKGDTEMFEYTDSEGNIKLKRGITYNPIVKTKLMGVLTGCLIKAKDPTYSQIYYDYKARLDNSAKAKDYTAAHKNMMAQRYMIKQFLRNLHTTWRVLEGLPVYEPYEVEKLGNRPHHLNEFQHQMANR